MFRFWALAVAGILAAIVAVLLPWGGSLLYRALDGDRFTVRGRARGRWANRVSVPLLLLAAGSIAAGSFLGFFALVATGSAPPLWHAASACVAAAAVATLAWARAGRRSAGKPRCPVCGYDISTLDTDTCPECGFVATEGLMWHRPRVRKRGMVCGGALALLAAAMIAAPIAVGYRWRALVPTGVLIAGMDVLPDSLIGGNERSYYGGAQYGSLAYRLANGTLSAAQTDKLRVRLAEQVVAARNTQELGAVLTMAGHMPLPVEPPFTAAAAERFIDGVLLETNDATLGIYIPPAPIAWSNLGVLSAQAAQSASDRLVERAASSPGTPINRVRWLAAAELAADPLGVLVGLMDAAGEDPSLRLRPYSVEVVRAYSMAHPGTPAAAWGRWLGEKDGSRRDALLRIVAVGGWGMETLSPELAGPVWDGLLRELADEPLDDGEDFLHGPMSPASIAMNALLRQSHIDALAASIRTGRLGAADIALLAHARFGALVPFDPALLTGLFGNEDPLVRAAAARSVLNNWVAWQIAFAERGRDIDALIDTIRAGEPGPDARRLIEHADEVRGQSNIAD